ncbi:MAG: gamma-glutamyl-gamma-aminobutyrate hydrolase family protein [Saccharofermentans sp.]|nr:gamma-glutamyl-gamma-aminobutyrate hydrolase family protein [Saccharofermentans sp.]
MKPIIGLVPLIDEKKESFWMLPGYMDGITEAGGIPVMLPLTHDEGEIEELLDHMHGILLTGGHDVSPALYNEKPLKECAQTIEERDRMEMILLKKTLERDMPVLGICRGIQFLNVFTGGTLYQDLPTQRPTKTEHHQSPPYDIPVHEVTIKDDSKLFKLLGKSSIRVNSYHHQAIKDIGEDLKIMAISEDGLTEAVEMPDKRFVWAVQWHPEFAYKKDDVQRKIFEEFVKSMMG